MTELTFERRDNNSLVLLDVDGSEFFLPVTEALLAEVKMCLKQQQGSPKINPAKVQMLLRRGHTITEVASLTGYDPADIERFEPPVTAEREYILQRAHEVPVRTKAKSGEADEKFGAVISDRLITLAAEKISWESWKDEFKGWQVAVSFVSYGAERRAVWSFNSAKNILVPQTQEATELSKQQQVGDSLIPKLRPVPSTEKPHPAGASLETSFEELTLPDFPLLDSPQDPDVLTEQTANDNLNETANLVEALRLRRTERENSPEAAMIVNFQTEAVKPQEPTVDDTEDVWESGHFSTRSYETEQQTEASDPPAESIKEDATTETLTPDVSGEKHAAEPDTTAETQAKDAPKKRGRTAIPSWDQILFGTRSEEDPR